MMLAAVTVCAVATLWVARAYQGRAVTALFRQYVEAPRLQVQLGPLLSHVLYRLPIGYPPGTDPYPVDVVEIETNPARCDSQATVTFRYRDPRAELTHVVSIAGRMDLAGPIRVFEPVYDGFEGVQFAAAGPECVAGVFKMSAPDPPKVLLSATLAPDWEAGPLYEQRVGRRWASR